ncbi:MAG: phosphoglycerate mutase family protein [Steroidobacteraceae bacterium]
MPSQLADSPAPAITRRHRPFLAPVWLGLLIALAILGVGLALHAMTANTVVVVVPAASGELGSIDNAPLSAAGGQQAQRLAQRFATASGSDGLNAIYVSDTRRAEQTAEPVAQLLGLRPTVLSVHSGPDIADQIIGQHLGETILVVCNRQVIADLIHALSGERIPPAAERDMYIVTIPRYDPARVLRMHD